MRHPTFLLALPLFALAACGEEPAPEPVETAAPEPVVTLPAPDEELFTQVFAESCEGAEPVSTAVCKRAMGADTATCEFGLGEDDVLRHEATISVNEDKSGWDLADAENICVEHGAHHVDS